MTVLFVNSSPRGDRSESLGLAEALLDAAVRTTPPLVIDRLDLFADPLPPFSADAAFAKMRVITGADLAGSGDERDPAITAWRAVVRTAERVRAADTLVFTVPMWNSSIPWALKLFIDTVTQPGLAFRFTPTDGYSGLLGGRRAIAIYTSHVYAPGLDARFGTDFHSTYVENWLRFVGIDRIDTIRLQTTHPGRADLAQARAAATARARELGATIAAAPVSA